MTRKDQFRTDGQIRIISGLWRGRKLLVPNIKGLRPTTDRVRETLFNWLAADIQDKKCLDCFAGSGALGLEALSRYAGSVTLLEMEKQVVHHLEKSIAILGAKNARVVNTNTLQYLERIGELHQLVFIDPPFRKGLLRRTIMLLEENTWLSDGARVYVESEVEKSQLMVPINWSLYREKKAGQVSCRLYIRHAIHKGNI